MKLLHIIATVERSSGGPIEGIIQQNASLGEAYGREVLCFDPPGAKWLQSLPLQVHALGYSLPGWSRFIPKHKYGFSLPAFLWLIRNGRDFDLIVVNGLWNFSSAVMSLARHFIPTPYVVYPHGMLDPWFAKKHPLKHLLKLVSWHLFEGGLLHGAAAVCFTTEEERVQARVAFGSHYNGLITKYGTTPPPPRDTDSIAAFRSLLPRLGGRQYILFLGRVHEKKGVDLLIQGFARTADSHNFDLVIAGPVDAAYRRLLDQMSTAVGIEHRVHWSGMVTGPAKYGALYDAGAFILPSHQENFGIAVAEALSCRCPVIISDKVNIYEDVLSANAGIVIKDTIDGVQQGIEEFLGKSSTDLTAMTENASQLFAQEYNLHSTSAGTWRMFEVLSERKR